MDVTFSPPEEQERTRVKFSLPTCSGQRVICIRVHEGQQEQVDLRVQVTLGQARKYIAFQHGEGTWYWGGERHKTQQQFRQQPDNVILGRFAQKGPFVFKEALLTGETCKETPRSVIFRVRMRPKEWQCRTLA